MKTKVRLGILGFGQMGEALGLGVLKSKDSKSWLELPILGTRRSGVKSPSPQVQILTQNLKCATRARVLVLAVKPHQAREVIEEIRPALTPQHLLISLCAAVTTEQLERWIGAVKLPVIRAMPNTPCLIREGMTVLAQGRYSKASHLALADRLFQAVGKVTQVDEAQFDGVTGLSGCGPAYVYLMLEAMSEAGVKVGLRRETATLLAAQTFLGASKMVMERGVHPASLKDEVTTPAGCTIDGLMALEEGKLRVTLIKAVLAATERSAELGERED